MGKKKKKTNKPNKQNKPNKPNNYNKYNYNKSNNKETFNKEKESSIKDNNQSDDMVTFTNYDLDKRLILEQTKKLDIEKIFEQPKTKPNKINKWKLISLILLFIIIILVIIGIIFNINKKCDTKIVDCEQIKDENKKNDIEEKDDKVDEVKEEKYVFLGDSIFEQYMTSYFFKGYDTVNSGVSGITALKTLERLDSGLYEYNPTTIFILLGTNDLYFGYTEEETFEHLKNLINKIHEDKPEIVINVLSLLPINLSDDPKINKSVNENRSNEKINKVNKYLKDFCDSKKINYINVHDILLDEKGELDWNYTREGLHITDLGYHHITMELLKYMKK